MKKLIQNLWICPFIVILSACSAPTSGAVTGGAHQSFEVSPQGLDRTAWRATRNNGEGVIILLEKNGNSLNYFVAFYQDGAETVYFTLLKLANQWIPAYIITKFIDNKAYLSEHGIDGATDTIFLSFENSRRGDLVILDENGQGDPAWNYKLERIPYPADLSSKAPAWTIDTLNEQKWIQKEITLDVNNIYHTYYRYPMIFKKHDNNLEVYFTLEDKYGYLFSSAEEAFASISYSDKAQVTEINNQEHSITIDCSSYGSYGNQKWKLYFASSNYAGLIYLSSSNNSRPLPLPPVDRLQDTGFFISYKN